MKLVHLTVAILIATLFAVTPRAVCGQETEKSDNTTTCSPCGQNKCVGCSRGEPCLYGGGNSHQDCMIGRYGYGKAPLCEKAKNGEPCPVHGHGPCPEERSDFGLGIRQALTPADHPYFGMQPLAQPLMLQHRAPYGNMSPHTPYPHGYQAPYPYSPMESPPQPRFPRLHSYFVQPIYMTTSPPPPMPTYTTRGPRDFLNPNPPSIGY